MFDEKKVIATVLSGNLKAFELLVQQYESLVFYIINKIVTDRDEQADICQDVFIKVYNRLSKFQFKSKLSTWIAQIAYNTALNAVRDRRTGRTVALTEDIDNFHFTTESPDHLLDKKELSAYINKLIDCLPLQLKTVLILYHLKEFTYKEIEEITGMPEGTVKSYLFRARKLLKEKIEISQRNEGIRL